MDTDWDIRGLGYMPKEVGLYKNMPLMQTLLFFGALRGLTRTQILSVAELIIRTLGLEAERLKPIGKLSKGMKCKV